MTKQMKLQEPETILRLAGAAYPTAKKLVSAVELTRGVSGATVHRLTLDLESGDTATAIVKTSAPDASGIRQHAGNDVAREVRVYGHALTSAASSHIVRPKYYGNGMQDGRGWILIEDVASDLDVVWNVDRAVQALRAAATVDLELVQDGQDSDWVVGEHHAFEHHLPAAWESVDVLERCPERMSEIGGEVKLGAIRDWLSDAPKAADQLDRVPQAFQHGDLNNSNMGFTPAGLLILIDWAQAGVAPIGSDLAVFLSGFLGFGGNRGSMDQPSFDALMLREYAEARADNASLSDIQRVVDLWSTSWALEARLGAGLPAAWSMDPSSSIRSSILADVREGLERAFHAAGRLQA